MKNKIKNVLINVYYFYNRIHYYYFWNPIYYPLSLVFYNCYVMLTNKNFRKYVFSQPSLKTVSQCSAIYCRIIGHSYGKQDAMWENVNADRPGFFCTNCGDNLD